MHPYPQSSPIPSPLSLSLPQRLSLSPALSQTTGPIIWLRPYVPREGFRLRRLAWESTFGT